MTADLPLRGRRLSVAERREQIVRVALDLFARRDARSVAVEEVAARAGVSPALVHHYFGGRSGLAEAALDAAATDLLERLADLPAGPPALRVATGLRSYLEFVADHPSSWAALLRAGNGDTAGGNDAARIARRVDDAALELCLETVAPDGYPPVLALALRGWLGFVKESCACWLVDRDVDLDQLHALLSAAFVGALQSAAAVDDTAQPAVELFVS